MKASLESTSKIVSLALGSPSVDARIWEGVTEKGVKFHAYIVRVAVAKGQASSQYEQFETELRETRVPSADVAAIPLRLIL